MQNRDYKIFVAGEWYHIFNRGNGGQHTFLEASDYLFFLRRLREAVFPSQRTALSREGRPLGGGEEYVRSELPSGSFYLARTA